MPLAIVCVVLSCSPRQVVCVRVRLVAIEMAYLVLRRRPVAQVCESHKNVDCDSFSLAADDDANRWVAVAVRSLLHFTTALTTPVGDDRKHPAVAGHFIARRMLSHLFPPSPHDCSIGGG